MELRESHIFDLVRGVHAYPRQCGAAHNVALLRNRNAMGVVLKGEDEAKLRYLTFAMTASKMHGKLTYTAWLRYFDKKRAELVRVLGGTLLAYWLPWFIPWSDPEAG